MTKTTLTINVTKRDILKGTAGMGHTCPVARALNRTSFVRALSGRGFVGVHNLYIERGEGPDRVYELPQLATDFILSFDDDRPVKPSKFEVVLAEL
jgi:hypothetical protein